MSQRVRQPPPLRFKPWFIWLLILVGISLIGGSVYALIRYYTHPPNTGSVSPTVLETPSVVTQSPAVGLSGTSCPSPSQIDSVHATISVDVAKGYALVLTLLTSGTDQVVGLFKTSQDRDGFIANHKAQGRPIYDQPQTFQGPSILILRQRNASAYDLVVLVGDHSSGAFDCRVVPDDQISGTNGVTARLLHHYSQQLQNINPPIDLTDYSFTDKNAHHFS
jgi:hypothetical protein